MAHRITQKVSLAIILLSQLFSIHAAAHDEKANTPRFSYISGIAAATATIGCGYALASYAGILPAWLPSPAPLISKIQEKITKKPTEFATLGLAVTAQSYVLYKAVCVLQAKRILNALPPVGKTPPSFKLSEDEQNEISIFLENQFPQSHSEQINFALPTHIPSSIRSACSLYQEEAIPAYAHAVIKKAVHDVGISEPIFFYQTIGNNHASSSTFNQIGLHPKTLQILNLENRKIFSRAGLPWISNPTESLQNDFFRTLYHELCHIKEQHSQKKVTRMYKKLRNKLLKNSYAFITKTITDIESTNNALHTLAKMRRLLDSELPADATTPYGLYHEMEAELGSVYYLKRLHNLTPDCDYQEDPEHPNNADQNRYNGLLLQRLEADPDADYIIVKEIAKEYLIEKEPWFATFFELEEFVADMKPAASSSSSPI